MALADSVPGVSGGTVAFLLGFYDKFIMSLDYLMSGTKEERIEAIKFLIRIGIGWVVGMGAAVSVLASIFDDRIYEISSLFLGLIIFAIPMICKEEKDSLKGKYQNIIWAVIGVVLVAAITYFNPVSGKGISVSVEHLNIALVVYIFAVAMVAISAMVLPGISGSTMLLIFGLYVPVITALKEVMHLHLSYFPVIVIFGLGVLTGIALVIKLIRRALENHRSAMIYFVIGMMIGSLYAIIQGPTTLDVPQPPMNISTFHIGFFILGAVILGALEFLKTHLEKQDVASSRALFERRAQTADQALAILNTYVPEKKGMLDSLAGKPLVEKELFEKAAENQDQYMATASRIVTLDKQIAESKAAVLKVQNQVEALAPWLSLTVPVSYTGTQKTAVLIGTMPNPQDQQSILNLLAGAVPDVEAVDVELISTDKDFTYLAVICMKQDAGKVEEVLRTGGFSKPSSPVQKIPEEYKKDLEAEIAKAQEQVKQLESELAECAVSRQDLELISDYYRTRAEKYRILGEIPQTASTFAISGYVPAAKADAIVKELSEHYGAAAETEEIKEEEEPPVLLHNNRFSESVEGVLASFGLPAKGEIDPTFFTSIFYVFLFGLMLSDAAYGLIVSLACGIVLLKFPRMETNLRKSVQLFFWPRRSPSRSLRRFTGGPA